MKLTIFDRENWSEIATTLSRNKTRTFLTAFGIFWGTAMLAMLWGGASGLEGMLRRNFEGFSTNMGVAFPNRTTMPYHGFSKGREWQFTLTDANTILRQNPYIDLSTTLCQVMGTARYATKSSAGSVLGVDADYFSIQLPIIFQGRVLNESDVAQKRKVVVIGQKVAGELFGDEDPLGKYMSINGIYFMVVGVVGQAGEASIGGKMDNSMIVPSSTMRQAFNLGEKVYAIIYTARQGYRPKDIEPTVRHVAISNHPIHPDDTSAIAFMDISDNFEMVDNLFIGISMLALFVGLGTLMAGIIGIGNIMWIIVRERTQEIGIRRAIGAKPRDIITQILLEGMVLTAIAGVAGICFATAVLAVAEHLTYNPLHGSAHFQLAFSHAIVIMITFLALGTAAGIIPAIKAMRIKPIEAINQK